ncbi:MAG: thiamine phosphate synthase [Prevotella sp.]|nr:thiamine phosphate synthase [Candidatus Prevotella equi]
MIIVITLPTFFDGEAERIASLLRQGDVDLIHIRKPNASLQDTEDLINAIPQELHRKLVLHDHHSLAIKYRLFGVHLNSRNPEPPKGWKGSISRSCHSIEEVKDWKHLCNYVSLSPIFNSISKPGYNAAFTHQQLTEAHKAGIIDDKVLALGGITFNNMKEVLALGFGGAMILGDAWKMKET